jgi:hypothetical protein
MALTKVTSNVIADNAVTQNKIDSTVALGIKISNIQVTNSGGTVLDDTAVDISGGYIVLTGAGFVSGCQVLINNVLATSTTFVNSTTIRAQLPATAAGTYIVYVANPDGSVGIRVNGVTFSATPSWVTGSSLEGNVDTALSLQLSATGASTFALQSGSTLPTGLTLSSGGLISGTVTGLTQETVYSFTVIATDAENQDSPRTFSITITVGDQYFNRTVLAINGDVNTFVSDASTNNFPITVVGDTRPSNFSPYNTNWSNEFDGTGDSLQITGSAALSSTGDFTIEGWGYFRSISNYTGIFSMRNATTAAGASINILNTGNFDFSVNPGGEYSATAVPLNRWFHVALVRSGSSTNNVSCYLDGVRVGQFTSNSQANGGSNVAIIGRYYVDGTDQYHANGFISNVRYVNGTALYSGATITVPTSPLTAVTNTAILTCQSNRLIDNSTNAFTIQRNGDTKVSAFGPFTETDTTTGSGYFDGTGDSLSIAANNAFNVGTNDACVECWVYFNSTASNQTLNGQNSGAGSTMRIGIWSGLFQYTINDDTLRSSGVTALAGQWYHLALTITGGTTRYFINGILRATATGFTVNSRNETYFIGSEDSAQVLNGYMRDFRFTNGSIPVAYQTSSTTTGTQIFNVPTAPLTAVANTQILTLQTRQPVNNHSFIDASRNNLLVTKTGNPIQGSFSPFSPAGWSAYFDGTGDSLQIGTTNAPLSWLNTAGAVGTIEAWIYPTAFRAGANVNTHPAILGIGGTYLNFGLANGIPRFFWWTGSVNNLDAGSAVALNAWTHIALVFNGSGANNLKMYVNGTIAATGTFTNIAWASASGGDNVYIGAESSNASSIWLGYISNLRIVNGTALYTGNFTPPESALTAIANTRVLTCQSNRFIDNSTNNYTITRNGDTAVVNFSPFKPTAAYSPVTHGGSGYFDGSGDYTTATGNSLLLGSNNFTIEGWFYFNNGAENAVRVMCVNYSAGFVAGGIYFGKHSNNAGVVSVWVYNYSTGGPLLTDPTLPPTNEWVHYALVRSGNNWTLYRNGVSVATATSSASLSTTNNFFLVGGTGENGAYTHNGYISGFKITNGTALYTSNFSVPTSPATASNNTSLLLNYNNAGIVDTTSRNVLETVGDSRIVTSTKKFGTGSMYFDGTGDRVSTRNSAFFNFSNSSTEFTIEAWVYNLGAGAFRGIAGARANAQGHGWAIYIHSSNTFYLGSVIVGTAYADRQLNTTVIPASTWTHVALVKTATNYIGYVNGVGGTPVALTGGLDWQSAQPVVIGDLASNGEYAYYGYIDDFRITRFARYTANFTPPTGTFLVR